MKVTLGKLAFLLMMTTVAAGIVGSTVPQKNAEEAAVRQTVETYLHGLKFNDVESFKKAFYPEAKLYFVKKDNQLGQLTQEDWYKGFAKVAGKEEQGELKISAVDISGNAASVKVEEDYP